MNEIKTCAICGLSEKEAPGPWIRVKVLYDPQHPVGWVCSRERWYDAPACKADLDELVRERRLEVVQ